MYSMGENISIRLLILTAKNGHKTVVKYIHCHVISKVVNINEHYSLKKEDDIGADPFKKRTRDQIRCFYEHHKATSNVTTIWW